MEYLVQPYVDLLKRLYCHASNYAIRYWSESHDSRLLDSVALQVEKFFFDVPCGSLAELVVRALIKTEEHCWELVQWSKLLQEAKEEKWSPGRMLTVLCNEAPKMKRRVICFAREILTESMWERFKDWWNNLMWWVPRVTKTKKWFEDTYSRFHKDHLFHRCLDWYYTHYTPSFETSD